MLTSLPLNHDFKPSELNSLGFFNNAFVFTRDQYW